MCGVANTAALYYPHAPNSSHSTESNDRAPLFHCLTKQCATATAWGIKQQWARQCTQRAHQIQYVLTCDTERSYRWYYPIFFPFRFAFPVNWNDTRTSFRQMCRQTYNTQHTFNFFDFFFKNKNSLLQKFQEPKRSSYYFRMLSIWLSFLLRVKERNIQKVCLINENKKSTFQNVNKKS